MMYHNAVWKMLHDDRMKMKNIEKKMCPILSKPHDTHIIRSFKFDASFLVLSRKKVIK